jgi:undecaprenyl-diphosphatase
VELVQAIVLGIVQGATEFLPISSSGHLVLVPALLGWEAFAGNIAFDVLLHAGSLIAVLIYFRSDFARMITSVFSKDAELADDRHLAWLIVIGTFVTGAIGLAFDDFFESLFHSTAWVGLFLLVTSAILVAAEKLSSVRTERPEKMGVSHAIMIGLAQAAAIAPGISRSGATISAGLGTGLTRPQAARFSFLLSAPIILLATAKTAYDAIGQASTLPGLVPSVAGFLAAAVSGYAAIAWLLSYLRNRSLYPFAVYTAIVGTAVVIWQVAL